MNMMYTPDDILNELKSYTTLNNGDVVMTGTPSGVGIVHEGDIFTGRIKQYDQLLIETQWIAN